LHVLVVGVVELLADVEQGYRRVHGLAYSSQNGQGAKVKTVDADPVGELATDAHLQPLRDELELAARSVAAALSSVQMAKRALLRGQNMGSPDLGARGAFRWNAVEAAAANARAVERRRREGY
jgi:hypothetical protein